MARPKICPKCQSSMTEGFVLDRSDSSRSVSGWVEGTPVRSLWAGVKVKSRLLEITTWRCGSCGFLESYTNPD